MGLFSSIKKTSVKEQSPAQGGTLSAGFEVTTWNEFRSGTEKVAHALQTLGIGAQENVGVFSANTYHIFIISPYIIHI